MARNTQAPAVEDWIAGQIGEGSVVCLGFDPEGLPARLAEQGHEVRLEPPGTAQERPGTLVVGELSDLSPEGMADLLVDGGRLLVATPMGLTGSRIRAVYPYALAGALNAHFRITRVQVLEGTVLVAADRHGQEDWPGDAKVSWHEVLGAVERAFREKETTYLASREGHPRREGALRRELEELGEREASARQAFAREEGEGERLRRESEERTRERFGLQAQLERLLAAIERDGELRTLEETGRRLGAQLTGLREDEEKDDGLAGELAERIGELSREVRERKEVHERLSGILERLDLGEEGDLADSVRRLTHRMEQLGELHERVIADDRYQAGDAVVRALRPSVNTLMLPVRLARMIVKRAGGRRVEESRAEVEVPVRARVVRQEDVRMCAVLDEFSERCFAPECRMIQPRPDNWTSAVSAEPSDLVFAESAWRGNGGAWQYRVARYNAPPGRELMDLTAWASERGIPTVFWNKEDPVHHESFIDAARLFDVVLTTDAGCVDRYRSSLGHGRAHVLPFAAQPALHNPMDAPAQRLPRACFAGSYYRNRHPERQAELEMLLDAAGEHGLDIYDRNHGNAGPGADAFLFPERFRSRILGRLGYQETVEAYRRYRVFLNVNSVVDSPTMCSRRVFELLACGTPVVSTPSRGIEELLGTDGVWVVHNLTEAREAIHTLLGDDEEWRRRRLRGLRAVFGRHTYRHRFADVLQRAGIATGEPPGPTVLLLAKVRTDRELGRVLDDFGRQSWQASRLLVHAPEGLAPEVERVGIAHSEEEMSAGINALLQDGTDLVGTLRADCIYGPCYLEDLVYAWRYAGAQVVGKAPAGVDLFRAGGSVHPAGCLIDATAHGLDALSADSDPLDRAGSGASRFVADAAGFVAGHAGWDDPASVERARSRSEV